MLIDDLNFVIVHQIVSISSIERMCFQRIVDVVKNDDVGRVVQVIDFE